MAEPDTSSVQDAETAQQKPSVFARYLRIFKLAYPRLPMVVQIAISHTLGLSEASKYRELRSHLVFSVIKSVLVPSNPSAVGRVQAQSKPKLAVKGRMWVSTYTSPPPPETGARDVIMDAIAGMVQPDGSAASDVPVPEFAPVEAEWTGYRAGVSTSEPPPEISDQEMYSEMMKEVKHPATVLYLHGGGYYLMDPSTHRQLTKTLAQLSGGRCYSVRYRLSPQAEFPTALLDAFVSYLTLLYPPPDAYHEPVKAEHIVISGDSAGGNLTLSLLQLLLELRRKNARVQWYGQEREIPLPAGAAGNSPWLDLTHSLVPYGGEKPSTYDYLPDPTTGGAWGGGGMYKSDSVWPVSPPRKVFYAADHLVTHPLVSIIGTRAEDWKDSPPIYMCTGWELIGTEDRVFARRLAKAGVPVVFEDYEAMPHCFALVLSSLPESKRCFQAWTDFIKTAVESPGKVETKAVLIKAKSREEVPIPLDDIAAISEEEAVAAFENQSAYKVAARL